MGNRKREKQNLKSLLYRESVIEYGTKWTRVRNLRKPGRMPSSPKGGESDITIANAESSGKRRKLARAPIPCKHLQWICELFKRLNSLKNLVCTGVVCHRLRHPAPPSSICQRHAGGSFLPQTTKTPPPDPFRPRRSLTLCISNN